MLVSAAALAEPPRFDTPRPYGYVVGDVLRHDIDLTLQSPWSLHAPSVPKQGPVTYWLDVRSAEIRESGARNGRRYRIALEYQVFYIPREVTSLDTPAFHLTASDGEQSAEIPVPAWEFTVSPLHETGGLRRNRGLEYMRPDSRPAFRDTSAHVTRLTAFSIVLALLVAAWARHGGWFPGIGHRPFDIAYRQVRSLRRATSSREAFTGALRAVHDAFNATAGAPLFAGEIETFLHTHPRFMPLRNDIAAFFELSREVFFIAPDEERDTVKRIEWLLSLCRACRVAGRERVRGGVPMPVSVSEPVAAPAPVPARERVPP